MNKTIPMMTMLALSLGCASTTKPADSSTAARSANPPITVDVYKGEVATVNTYIFSNGKSLIAMDVQRATSEAKKLAELIRSKNLPLKYILITHGHPDHYTGMDWLLKEFPNAKVVVANADIKKDIIAFSTWMDGIGWLDAEPTLKPKSAKNPEGFDYENKIHVLDGNKLEFAGGGALTLETRYQPAESDHATTVYVEDLNALFTSDFGYNKVHLWMGSGVTDAHVQNWKEQLGQLQRRYADRNPTVHPGHGDASDMGLFAELLRYIEDFQRITAAATSKEQAMAEMKKLYPDYGEADFLLKNSVDFHVR